MALEDNYWDDARKMHVDAATGNTMQPQEFGGDGLWHSPDGRMVFYQNQWVPYQANARVAPTQQGPTPGTPTTTTTANVQQGLLAEQFADSAALDKYKAELSRQTQLDVANINREYQTRISEMEASLQRDLTQKKIDADQYMQQLNLAQSESQFARDLALKTLISDRENQLQQATLELNRQAEVRAERELQAHLAANPQDFVAYEYYKRMLGQPGAWDSAQTMMGDPDSGAQPQTQQVGSPTQTQFTGGPDDNLLGQPYEAAPPAYDDATLQNVIAGIQGGNGAEWNPNLAGTGAFGAHIQAPNALSRMEALSMSDTDMGILTSFLRAGIQVPGSAQRVALDPQEYFRQSQNSWIPTLASAAAPTRYS